MGTAPFKIQRKGEKKMIQKMGLRSCAPHKSLLDNGLSHSFVLPLACGHRTTLTARNAGLEANPDTCGPAKARWPKFGR